MKPINNELLKLVVDNCTKNKSGYNGFKILLQVNEILTWAANNNYQIIHGNRWVKGFSSFTISSEELFNEWLKEKNNEN